MSAYSLEHALNTLKAHFDRNLHTSLCRIEGLLVMLLHADSNNVKLIKFYDVVVKTCATF